MNRRVVDWRIRAAQRREAWETIQGARDAASRNFWTRVARGERANTRQVAVNGVVRAIARRWYGTPASAARSGLLALAEPWVRAYNRRNVTRRGSWARNVPASCAGSTVRMSPASRVLR